MSKKETKRLKASEKIALLRTLLAEADTTKDADFRARVEDALSRTTPRSKMTPEQKAAAKGARRFAAQLKRQVNWLILDGVKAGGFAVKRGSNEIVVVVTDPKIDDTGERVVMNVKSGKNGDVQTVDAMQYRPDFTKVPVTKTSQKRESERRASKKTK